MAVVDEQFQYVLARPVNKYYLAKILHHVVKGQTLCNSTKEGLEQKINLRTLIVDDNEFCRNAVARIVKQYVPLCSVFENPSHALSAISKAENPFDLAFIDYNMPDMNGIELVKRMREDEVNKEMTIIRIIKEVTYSFNRRRCCRGRKRGNKQWR